MKYWFLWASLIFSVSALAQKKTKAPKAEKKQVEGRAQTPSFDMLMQEAVKSYLRIQEAFSKNTFKGVSLESMKIAAVADKLDPKIASGEHADHYKNVPKNVKIRARALAKAKNIAEAREIFKKLSQPFAMWVSMAKPKNLQVVYCPMAKASWLQKKGTVVSNPYLTNMPKCGNIL